MSVHLSFLSSGMFRLEKGLTDFDEIRYMSYGIRHRSRFVVFVLHMGRLHELKK